MSEEKSEAQIAEEHEQKQREQTEKSAEQTDREEQEAKEEVKALEDDPPQDLSDWPSGKAKYETFGGPEHESSYEDSATENLGPADVRHKEDGSVEVAGEEVDNPDDFKGEPIPGGPTDPDAKGVKDRGEKREELSDEGRDPDEAPDPSETSHADPEAGGN